MDLKNLGSVILEALAVQGKIKNVEKQVNELTLQISKRTEEDAKRTKQVNKENATDLSKVTELGKEVESLKKELGVRVAELKANGVDINTEVTGASSISM